MNTGSTVLDGISWQTYSQLRDELDASEQSQVHLTYDRGCLEIEMSPLPIHGERIFLLTQVVSVIADERGVDYRAAGDATFRRPEVGRAGEPDACFYFQNLDSLPREIDAEVHAPDLVIEVDITSLSVDKRGLYAAMNVAEIWHDDGRSVAIFILDTANGEYTETMVSVLFPLLDAAILTQFVEDGLAQRSTVWRRNLRAWARENQIHGNL
jgi:Uma2 family endonuclease